MVTFRNQNAWEKSFAPITGRETVIEFKLLFSKIPAILCFLGLILLKFYNLHGKKLKELRALI
jgi:Na+/melibiose symporter-like transporter